MTGELQEIIKEVGKADKMDSVQHNPITKGVIYGTLKMIPVIGDLVDETVEYAVDKFQAAKRNQFIEYIKANTHCVTKEQVSNVEFIINSNFAHRF